MELLIWAESDVNCEKVSDGTLMQPSKVSPPAQQRVCRKCGEMTSFLTRPALGAPAAFAGRETRTRDFCQLVAAVRRQAKSAQERHWEVISEKVGFEVKPYEGFTFN